MNHRKTKIVATVSSRNCSVELLRSLHQAGMDVARINSAHLSPEEAGTIIANLRAVSDRIAILIDTKGPEVRTCDLAAERPVRDGESVTLGGPDSEAEIPVNYQHFAREVPPGARIVIDDGQVELAVERRECGLLACRVLGDGVIRSRKTVNVPGVELKLPAVSRRDREFIELAIAQQVDFIAHSFVRGHDDVMAVQSILDTAESPIRIIAKIENRQGVEHLDEILNTACGVMVARGDLGVEIPLEEVPEIQKRIIYACMRRRKVVITATQMLQSMEQSPRPTRAEVSDVANAVLDGTDAVMLSGETANGRYPLESIRMMARTVLAAEQIPQVHFTRVDRVDDQDDPVRGFVVRSAIAAARELPVKAILCHTASGDSARLCSAYRSRVDIIALSHQPQVVRQLALSFGVRPFPAQWCGSSDELFRHGVETALAAGEIEPDDLLALMVSYPVDTPGANLVGVVRAREVREQFGGKGASS